MRNSRIKGFYKLGRGERLDKLQEFSDLPVDQLRLLGLDGALPFEVTDLFVENAVGAYPLPLGMATSFKINGHDYLVPMAVEESSVIAAASNAARWVYESGGFESVTVSAQMIGQIQLLDIPVTRFAETIALIESKRKELLEMADAVHPRLLMRGGGARDIEVRSFMEAEIPFIVVHVCLDTRDAMGANLVNTVCERLAPYIEDLTHGRVGLRILSNLADRRVFRARARVNPEMLTLRDVGAEISGFEIAKRIHEAFVFADTDPYRATTHNKGIMNGIDPVVIATGNDWRAIEAGAHAFAARTGRYRSLSKFSIDPKDGWLIAEIELPLQVGTVGGVTRLHPMARLSLQVLGNPSSEELGQIMACSGLASNLAALRALVSTGIQRGHMKLHAKNLALAAGARKDEVEVVARRLVEMQNISASAAEEILDAYRQQKSPPQRVLRSPAVTAPNS